MRENTDQKNSQHRYFSCNAKYRSLNSVQFHQASFIKACTPGHRAKTYIRCSKNVLGIFWTFYVHSVYVLRPRSWIENWTILSVILNSSSSSFQYVKKTTFKDVYVNIPRLENKYQDGPAYIISIAKKCPYSECFWSVFSRVRNEYGFSPNAGKFGPENTDIFLAGKDSDF